MSHIPRHRLSNKERLFVAVVVLLLIPVVISPRLMLVFAVTVFPTVMLAFFAYHLIRTIWKGKEETPVVARHLRLSSRLQKPAKVAYHWTVTTAEPRDPEEMGGKREDGPHSSVFPTR